MNAGLLFGGLVVALIVVIALVVARRGKVKVVSLLDGQNGAPGGDSGGSPSVFTSLVGGSGPAAKMAQMAQLTMLAREGRTAEAVEVLKQLLGPEFDPQKAETMLKAFAGGENAQVSVSHTTVSTTNGAAVRDALARGDKIGAIKLLREQTGVGLKEAKEVIDALESGQSLNIATKQVSVVSDSEIEQLIRDDKMIYAIKAYREKTGASLKEAKDAVDAIKAAMEH